MKKKKVDKQIPVPEPEELDITVEIDPEHQWRCEQLVKLGFSDFQAFRLSINGADWHDCRRLLRAGATHGAVLDILI